MKPESAQFIVLADALPLSPKEAERFVDVQGIEPEKRSLEDWRLIEEICYRLIEKQISRKSQMRSRKYRSYMDAYQDLSAIDGMNKMQLMSLSKRIGIKTKRQTAFALRTEIWQYLTHYQQLAIPELTSPPEGGT